MDKPQAVYWFRKAANQGHAAAQYNLGNAYYFSEGVSADETQAVYWWRKAAEQGHRMAINSLSNIENN